MILILPSAAIADSKLG